MSGWWLLVPPLLASEPQPVDRAARMRLHRTQGAAWVVQNGVGDTIDARVWWGLTGDGLPLERATRAARVRAGWPLRAAGIAGFVLAAVPAAMVQPLPSATPDSLFWNDAERRNEVARTSAFALATAGGVLVAVSFVDQPARDVRLGPLRRWLDGADADRAIAAYNLRVVNELGG